MEDVKINYIIASYNGITGSRKCEYSEKVLDFQLEKLRHIMDEKKKNNIDCLVKKITIIITDSKKINSSIPTFENYYLFDKWKHMFSDIEISFQPYVGSNNHFSYDQWLQGIINNLNDYTHHIIIEDDYCIDPECLNFDIMLIDIYKKKFKDNIGFLSQKYGDDIYNSWISNGLISSDTLKKIDDPLTKFYGYNLYPQITFGYLFTDNGIPITDYSEYFKITFWDQRFKELKDMSENKNIEIECFIPVEKIILK